MSEDDYIEATPELVTSLKNADARVDDLYTQLRIAEGARQELLDSVVRSKAKFKIGDDVNARGRRYRITKVQGDYWQVKETQAHIRLKYYGKRVKVDGSLFDEREKWIWDLTALDAQEGE